MNPVTETEDALYDAARHLSDPGARTAFLDQVCAGSPALRQRLKNCCGPPRRLKISSTAAPWI